ncbi:MAG: hypothetical protein RMJ43_00665 [Chloroherpetonaceae bacterium]|nr:hypothetical protein [Chthonomonadaceae bacterium]MDW8206321.1 hypothetical protein [Chloroherpetonaceae bacterium]
MSGGRVLRGCWHDAAVLPPGSTVVIGAPGRWIERLRARWGGGHAGRGRAMSVERACWPRYRTGVRAQRSRDVM